MEYLPRSVLACSCTSSGPQEETNVFISQSSLSKEVLEKWRPRVQKDSAAFLQMCQEEKV
jgi:hypothetical protein